MTEKVVKKLRKRKGELRLYKPRLDAKTKKPCGAASVLDVSIEFDPDPKQKILKKKRKVLVFWTTAQQLEKSNDPKNAAFAWSNENRLVRFKLEAVDIAEILLVLRGKKESAGAKGSLYHQTPKGNTIFELKVDTTTPGGFSFSMSNQKKGGTPVKVFHRIGQGEALLIESFLSEALNLIHNLAK